MIKVIQFFLRSSPSGRGTKVSLLAAVLLSLVGGSANIALLTLISRMLSGDAQFHWSLITSILLLGTCLGVTRGVAQYLLSVVTLDTLVALRLSFCTKLTAAPLATLEGLGNARLTAAFADSMPTISNALMQLPNIFLYIIVTTGSIAYLGWLSWKALAVTIVAGACFFLFYRNVNLRAQAEFGTAFTHYRAVLKGFRELIDGVKELKSHRDRRKDHLARAIAAPLDGLARHRMKSSYLYGVAEAWFTAGMFFSIAVILTITRGQERNVGTGYVVVLLYLLPFVQGIVATMPAFSQAEQSIASIEELAAQLSKSSDITEVEHGFSPKWERLTLEAVTYQYTDAEPESSFQIGPVDLTLKYGETVFVTGGNGSGKTTLIKVIAGLYKPQGGSISVDGVPVINGDVDSYRHRFSAVFADFHLFDQIYGLSNIDSEASAYLKHLKLDHKIKVEGGRLSTISLSQGQKKRLALLTAYLEDRPIYVFDEWAADQDVEFRDFFYYDIIPGLKRRGKTILVITHDDRYFHLADRVVTMELGRVTRDSMMMKAGVEAFSLSVR